MEHRELFYSYFYIHCIFEVQWIKNKEETFL